MIAVITGATSPNGVALTKYMIAKGHYVVAVARESEKINLLTKHSNLKIIYAELSDYSVIIKNIEKADIFFHLAWVSNREMWYSKEIQSKNVEYSIEALKIAKKINCKLFVSFGSQAEYGIVDELITENMPVNPLTDYGKSKLNFFIKGKKLSDSLNIKFLHLRLFSTYGINDLPHTLISYLKKKMKNNENIEINTDGTQQWNYLFVNDAAKLICELAVKIYDNSYAVENIDELLFNVASNDTRKLREFIEEMRITFHSSSNIEYGEKKDSAVVTLNPSIEKIEKVVGKIDFTPFYEGIQYVESIK